jgi:tetratricopeptide (TPR) repeat protein
MISLDTRQLRQRLERDAGKDGVTREDLAALAQQADDANLVDLAHWLRGYIALQAGRPADALTLADQILALDPTSPHGHYLKTQTLINERRYPDAIAQIDSALTDTTLVGRAWFFWMKAVAYEQLGRVQDAILMLLKSIADSDTFHQAYLQLLALLLRHRRWKDLAGVAAEILERKEKLKMALPSMAPLLLTAAENAGQDGDDEVSAALAQQAIPFAEITVETNPADVNARYNLSCAYARIGRREKALSLLRQVVSSGGQ